jgi:hypothetical protein
MTDEINFELPPDLPYTCTIESGHQTTTCQFCKEPNRPCNRYVLRFPDDQDFLDWESGKKAKMRRPSGDPFKAYTPAKLDNGTTVDGWFCSEPCAKRSYFPIYALWRLRGTK